MAKKYKMLNYGKKYKQLFIGMLQDSITSIRIPDEVTWLGRDRWAYDNNLTYIDFNRVETIPAETCRGCENLTQVVFSTHTTQIGDYAFYDCTKFEDTELPHTLTNIGQYAFHNAGSYYSQGTHTFTMIDEVGVHTTLGSGAFQGSHLSHVKGYFNDIGGYAFQNCKSLNRVEIEVHGTIGGGVFENVDNLTYFSISPDSVITNFSGQSTFVRMGGTNIQPFDFRNSTFSTIDYAWSYNHFDGIIYFPSTLTSLRSFCNNSTGNWEAYFQSVPAVASSTYLPYDTAQFTMRFFFPYLLLSTAASATNWANHVSQMIGYGTGYAAGETLPQFMRTTGARISWYSDSALTVPATVSAGESVIYYCVVGSTREVVFVDTINGINSGVTISDGVTTYTIGDAIPINTSLTITVTPDSGYNFLTLLINGSIQSQETATYAPTNDLTISSLCWDGVNLPLSATMNENSWDVIAWASATNRVPNTWAVGDTKSVVYDNITYTMRLVDKTGKMTRTSDGLPATLLFESVELYQLPQTWANSVLNVSKFETSLFSAIPAVDVVYAKGNQLYTDSMKTFMGREKDIFTTRYRSYPIEADIIVTDQFYASATSNQRRKAPVLTTNYADWRHISGYCSAGQESTALWNTGTSSGGTNNVNVMAVSGASYFAFRFAL